MRKPTSSKYHASPGYVIVDDRGYPRTVPTWPAVVQILITLVREDAIQIEAMRAAIDSGEAWHPVLRQKES